MPESRSRSRKRKAAASAAKTDSHDTDKDVQSYSCSMPAREERYVPRFSSATKRARTVSSLPRSQPALGDTVNSDKISTALENEEEQTVDNNKADDATSADKEVKYMCAMDKYCV